MSNFQGVIKMVFDNRMKDGVANKFPNFKFSIGEPPQSVTLWSAIPHPALVKGKLVSVTCGASKKTGALFVLNKEGTKEPMIQELKAPAPTQDTSFNPEELEQQLNAVAKDFNADLTVETKKPFNKDEYMFVMALAKSFIETGKINANRVEVDLLIKDIKFLYQMNFHN